MLATPLDRLRLVGWLEGGSFLLLLFVAMPLKYLAGRPEAVFAVGMAHGALFLGYLAALLHATLSVPLSWGWAAGGVAAGLLPFGPFVFDARLRSALSASVGGETRT
jgi:integral membrane protein